jgi:MFS-type transporter involved in bile tolerance (Atg22 family)
MYASLWRVLPGNALVKVLVLVLLAVAVIALLFGVVFPWLEPRLPFNQETVNSILVVR